MGIHMNKMIQNKHIIIVSWGSERRTGVGDE